MAAQRWHDHCFSPPVGVLSVIASTILVTAVAATTPSPSSVPTKGQLSVERESVIELAVPRAANVVVSYLPAKIGIEFDVPVAVELVAKSTESLDPSLRVSVEAIKGGSRVRVIHPDRDVEARVSRNRTTARIALGAVSEDSRLRELTRIIARPLPEPKGLGAYLELWQEAEAALERGELRRALELWEKLERAASIEDLAALRTAELFVLSGHVNEAVARLSSVSRRHPRSTGATLARLDLLHLDAITAQELPTRQQILITAQTVDRRRFDAYTWFRAAMVLAELGDANGALERMPRSDAMPLAWQADAEEMRLGLFEEAICRPVLRGDPDGTVVAHARWTTELETHPRKHAILRHVADAFAQLGLHAAAVEPLRALLRDLPEPREEARLVLALADAYLAQRDLERGLEVVTFAVRNHPLVPDLVTRLRTLGIATQQAKGLDATRTILRTLREEQPKLERTLLELEADFAVAYGSPLVQVQALTLLEKRGFDSAEKRGPQLGLALARAGRAKDAAPLLRTWIGKSTDPELRDHMAYRLADAERALGNEKDADKILKLIATRGTTYGQIARVRIEEGTVGAVLRGLEADAAEEAQP